MSAGIVGVMAHHPNTSFQMSNPDSHLGANQAKEIGQAQGVHFQLFEFDCPAGRFVAQVVPEPDSLRVRVRHNPVNPPEVRSCVAAASTHHYLFGETVDSAAVLSLDPAAFDESYEFDTLCILVRAKTNMIYEVGVDSEDGDYDIVKAMGPVFCRIGEAKKPGPPSSPQSVTNEVSKSSSSSSSSSTSARPHWVPKRKPPPPPTPPPPRKLAVVPAGQTAPPPEASISQEVVDFVTPPDETQQKIYALSEVEAELQDFFAKHEVFRCAHLKRPAWKKAASMPNFPQPIPPRDERIRLHNQYLTLMDRLEKASVALNPKTPARVQEVQKILAKAEENKRELAQEAEKRGIQKIKDELKAKVEGVPLDIHYNMVHCGGRSDCDGKTVGEIVASMPQCAPEVVLEGVGRQPLLHRAAYGEHCCVVEFVERVASVIDPLFYHPGDSSESLIMSELQIANIMAAVSQAVDHVRDALIAPPGPSCGKSYDPYVDLGPSWKLIYEQAAVLHCVKHRLTQMLAVPLRPGTQGRLSDTQIGGMASVAFTAMTMGVPAAAVAVAIGVGVPALASVKSYDQVLKALTAHFDPSSNMVTRFFSKLGAHFRKPEIIPEPVAIPNNYDLLADASRNLELMSVLPVPFQVRAPTKLERKLRQPHLVPSDSETVPAGQPILALSGLSNLPSLLGDLVFPSSDQCRPERATTQQMELKTQSSGVFSHGSSSTGSKLESLALSLRSRLSDYWAGFLSSSQTLISDLGISSTGSSLTLARYDATLSEWCIRPPLSTNSSAPPSSQRVKRRLSMEERLHLSQNLSVANTSMIATSLAARTSLNALSGPLSAQQPVPLQTVGTTRTGCSSILMPQTNKLENGILTISKGLAQPKPSTLTVPASMVLTANLRSISQSLSSAVTACLPPLRTCSSSSSIMQERRPEMESPSSAVHFLGRACPTRRYSIP